MIQFLRPLWPYRNFILGSVRREFQARYQNSLLGTAWAVISPLAMIVVYTVIFSQLMQARLPGIDSSFGYGIYLCAGILTWSLFADITNRALNTFVDHASLLKKLSFPRLSLPVVVVCNAWLAFVIILALFLLFLLITGNWPGWPLLAMLPLLILQTLFAISLGITLGVINVFFRDVGQFFGVVLQLWFWFTPIIYPVSILPDTIRSLMVFNPMAPLINGYQTILVYNQWPEWSSLWFTLALTGLLGLFGLRLFRRRAGEMVDEL